MKQLNIKEIFKSGSDPKLTREDQNMLNDMYREAEEKGQVLSSFMMLPESILGGRFFPGTTRDDLYFRLYNDAQDSFPGTGFTPQGISEFFQVTHVKPAMICDEARKTALFIFPVDRDNGVFTTYVFSLQQVKLVLETMVDQNNTYLKQFRGDEAASMNGVTLELARAKREAIEKTIRVFEKETGMKVNDNLREAFRAVSLAEMKGYRPDTSRETIASLIMEVIDHQGDEGAFKKRHLPQEPFANDTKEIAKAVRQKNGMSLN